MSITPLPSLGSANSGYAEFPAHGLLPKFETESLQFVEKHPTYDGRGVKIAILDTGVDPAAAGMQLCPDGSRKVIDIIDCTGSGDVDTTQKVKLLGNDDKLQKLTMLSGREIRINPKWKNPSGEWRVGCRRAYELYPKPLVTRIARARRRQFEEKHQALLAKVLLDDKEENEKSEIAREEKRVKAEILKKMMDDYNDPGPMFDVLHWHDGADWKAIVGDAEEDIDGNGGVADWSERWPMGDYAQAGEFSQFGEDDLLSYSFKFYESGDVVSIVVCSGSHGTHVAAIAAAFSSKEDPHRNGVAPGAQIISLKIGDTRLGSMETGAAFQRALIECVRLKIDIMNISYGEDASVPDRGQVIELMRKVVHEHGITVVSSAGNAGPALSTVGAPGGTTSGVISVGAYVSDAMMRAEYNMLHGVPETAYTWCSRGPTLDGARGVTIYAPGAAVTSVPQYCLQNKQLMNGTSMSSPSACGGIALVISALKQKAISYTPHRLRKAADFSSRNLNDELGVGFLQVSKMHDYIVANAHCADADVNFVFSVHTAGISQVGQEKKRGIYLRDPHQTLDGPQTFTVELKPELREAETRKKWALNLEVLLRTEPASAQWVQVPQFISLGAEGRSFDVRVDPTHLQPGLHFTEIVVFDTAMPGKIIAKLPITVTKPSTSVLSYPKMSFAPGKIDRKFIAVPEGATSATVRFVSQKNEAPVRLVAHITQLLPHTKHSQNEKYLVFSLIAGEPAQRRFAVRGGFTMEICLSQFWNSLGEMELDFDISFGGLDFAGRPLVEYDGISLAAGVTAHKFEFQSNLRLEELSPKIKFESWRKVLRPIDAIVTPLKTRDVLPDTKQLFQLVLEYRHKLAEGGEISYALQALSQNMYDSSLALVSAAFDGAGKQLFFGDVYPKKFKAEKGDVVIKVQLRHDSFAVLEKLKHSPLLLNTFGPAAAFDKITGFDFYGDHLFVGESVAKPFKSAKLRRGDRVSLTLSAPAIESKCLPAGCGPGDLLIGKMTFATDNGGSQPKLEDGEVTITYTVPPKEAATLKSREASNGASNKEKEKESIIDLQLEMSKKISCKKERLAFLDSLSSLKKDQMNGCELLHYNVAVLEILSEILEISSSGDGKDTDATTDKAAMQKRLYSLITMEILPSLQSDEILKNIGTKQLPVEQQSKETKAAIKANNTAKDALVRALTEKARVEINNGQDVEADGTLAQLRQFVDFASDLAAGVLHAQRELTCGRAALALRTLHKLAADNRDKAGEAAYKQVQKLIGEALKALDWQCWISYNNANDKIARPLNKFLF